MGYYNKNGYVGDYKGKQVYVINEEDYTEDKKTSHFIYAIRKMNNSFDLVYQGFLFAIMWDDGTIMNLHKKPWNFKKSKKSIEVKEEEEVKIDINKSDFSEYAQVVDDVFKNLNNWWEDLKKEGI